MIRPVALRLPFPPMYFPMLNAMCVVNSELIKNACPIRLKKRKERESSKPESI